MPIYFGVSVRPLHPIDSQLPLLSLSPSAISDPLCRRAFPSLPVNFPFRPVFDLLPFSVFYLDLPPSPPLHPARRLIHPSLYSAIYLSARPVRVTFARSRPPSPASIYARFCFLSSPTGRAPVRKLSFKDRMQLARKKRPCGGKAGAVLMGRGGGRQGGISSLSERDFRGITITSIISPAAEVIATTANSRN